MPSFIIRHGLLLVWFVALLTAAGCGSVGAGSGVVAGAGAGTGAVQPDAPPRAAHKLALSSTHSCALRQAGLYCWGLNIHGALGTGDEQDSEIPVLATVAGDDIVEVAAASGRTCVLRGTGAVECWGNNNQGQIGDGTRTASLTPRAALGITDAVQIAADENSTCALRAGGAVACWGGSPERTPDFGSLTPVTIGNVSGAVELHGATTERYCARGAEGWVRCWNLQGGAWGPGVSIEAVADVRGIAVAGADVVCALLDSGEVVYHNLTSAMTIPLASSAGTVELVGTSLVACGHKADGPWVCWNILPAMIESVGSPPIEIPSEVPLVEMGLGGFSICALRQDQQVVCTNANSLAPTWTPIASLPL